MGFNILSIAQSGLVAAQAGMLTTGHNIANSGTPGFSRQQIVQVTGGSQDIGIGFIGKGTQVSTVKRVYNEFLAKQVLIAQTSSSQMDTHYAEISRLNNLLADSSAGLSPALHDFFKGIQDLASNPSSTSVRQSALSAAEGLVSRFKSIDSQLDEMYEGVNFQIGSTVTTINSLATQIASLNDSIGLTQAASGANVPNDMYDQRDKLIADLAKEVKVSVVPQGNSYSVFIGNGQPLVVGTRTFTLVSTVSPTDLQRTQVGMSNNGVVSLIPESALPSGTLGGLFDFRANTLDNAQNSLGQVATGLAMTFNDQHRLGQDANGALGGDFFVYAQPKVSANINNSSTGTVTATISDASALTTSNYRLQITSGSVPGPAAYQITRLSDNTVTSGITSLPVTIDGIDFNISSVGTQVAQDDFLIQPTVNGASQFAVAILDVSKIAAASPLRTASSSANAGSGRVSQATVNSVAANPAVSLTFVAGAPGTLSGFPANTSVMVTTGGVATTYPAGATVPYDGLPGDTISFGGVQISGIPAAGGSYSVGPPVATLTYDSVTNTLSGFPNYFDVSVTPIGGSTPTVYPAGTPVPYTDGSTISYGGLSFSISGTPANTDTFSVVNNVGGIGDNRNALALAAMQMQATLDKNPATGQKFSTYQSAYGRMVNAVGNKTHELDVTGKAESARLEQSKSLQQSDAGVNLDEEATNLMRFQQAYQAAGKVIQTADTMFSVLLSLGGG